MHMDGLKRMVGIRGGLNAAREANPMLANSTFWLVFLNHLVDRHWLVQRMLVVAHYKVPFPSFDLVLPPFFPSKHNLRDSLPPIVTSHFQDISPEHSRIAPYTWLGRLRTSEDRPRCPDSLVVGCPPSTPCSWMSVVASLPLTLALGVAVGVARPFLLYYWAFESHKSACQKVDHFTDLYHVTSHFKARLPLFGAVLSEQECQPAAHTKASNYWQRVLRTPTPWNLSSYPHPPQKNPEKMWRNLWLLLDHNRMSETWCKTILKLSKW
jgi:hypothetical protein